MANDGDDGRGEVQQVFLAWGMPVEAREGILDDTGLWLTAGATVLVWTALALLLTVA